MIDFVVKIKDNTTMVKVLNVIGLLLLCGCGSSYARQDVLFPIAVDSSQTILSGDICQTVFEVRNLSLDQEYALIWLQVVLVDQSDAIYEKIYESAELDSILSQRQLPPITAMKVPLDIDFGGSGLGFPPFEGTLQMIGIGFQETVIFSGALKCQ